MCSRAGARQTADTVTIPFRLQHYYQYQVVIKPSPDDIQELYLESLRAIGIDPVGA